MLISYLQRYRRFRLSILAGFGATGSLILLGFALWQFIAAVPPTPQNFATPQKAQKAIILTGSYDRLQAGMKLLREGQVDSLFISGVYARLKLPELLHAMQETPSCAEENCIELGRRATNTRQNACESLEWLQQNDIRRFYLITSDYHWPRSYAEFQAILQRNDYMATILPYPVRPENLNSESFFLRSKAWSKSWSGEYFKWLIANGRIFLEKFLPKSTIMDCF